jgi:hypothetical protein
MAFGCGGDLQVRPSARISCSENDNGTHFVVCFLVVVEKAHDEEITEIGKD